MATLANKRINGRGILKCGVAIMVLLMSVGCSVTNAAETGTAKMEKVMPTPSVDVCNFVAHTYVQGVLSTNPARVTDVPRILGEDPDEVYSFLWALRIARPATSWMWGQAVLEDLELGQDGRTIIVRASVPDARDIINRRQDIPRAIREWEAIQIIQRTPPKHRATLTRTIKIRGDGTLDLNAEQRREWMSTPYNEIRGALAWCKENPDEIPKEYVLKTAQAVQASSLVDMPDDIKISLSILKKEIENGGVD